MDDYIRDGFLRAMAEVRRITDEPQINAVGYCIAGTTLGLTLAHLQRAGDTIGQIRHLLHHADRFFRSRRSRRLPDG